MPGEAEYARSEMLERHANAWKSEPREVTKSVADGPAVVVIGRARVLADIVSSEHAAMVERNKAAWKNTVAAVTPAKSIAWEDKMAVYDLHEEELRAKRAGVYEPGEAVAAREEMLRRHANAWKSS